MPAGLRRSRSARKNATRRPRSRGSQFLEIDVDAGEFVLLQVGVDVFHQVGARFGAREHAPQIPGLPSVAEVRHHGQHRQFGVAGDAGHGRVRLVVEIALAVLEHQPFRNQVRQMLQVDPQRDDAGGIPVDVVPEDDGLRGPGGGGRFGMDDRRRRAHVFQVFDRFSELERHIFDGFFAPDHARHLGEPHQVLDRGQAQVGQLGTDEQAQKEHAEGEKPKDTSRAGDPPHAGPTAAGGVVEDKCGAHPDFRTRQSCCGQPTAAPLPGREFSLNACNRTSFHYRKCRGDESEPAGGRRERSPPERVGHVVTLRHRCCLPN